METERKTKRCAIYTRKSLEDAVEKEFNSIDAQRDAGEAYVRSQRANGWSLLNKRYDDYGFSGGNTNRPALKELLADCAAGRVDVVVIYKLDRLSRSICDFAELSKSFDKWGVTFVSVTQEINTSSSSGRMMLNILMTFAQYEREVIAERIRDKKAATRRKGKWDGGILPYGYRVEDHKLVEREDESDTARRIFARYLEIQSPKTIARELNAEGTHRRTGKPWTPRQIGDMLRNVTYIGKVSYKGEVFEGEHEGLIDQATWEAVQKYMDENTPEGSRGQIFDSKAPLKGLLRCGRCGGAMTPAYTYRHGVRFRYYVCVKDTKRAVHECPIRRIAAGEIEGRVIECLRNLMQSPEVVMAVSDLARIPPKQVMNTLGDAWADEMTQEETNRLLHLLVEDVELSESEIVVELKTEGMQRLAKEAYGI
ncbi:MAG: recombinase family protein [Victivallales bacterium]|nr:recombinase family protein [Victivallales bacterium]